MNTALTKAKEYVIRHKLGIIVHIVLVVSTLIISVPFVYLLIKATQSRVAALSPSLIPGNLLWDNLVFAWEEYNFKQYTINTLIITTSITLGKTLLSLFAAMALVYFKMRWKPVLFAGILITLYIPTDLIAIGLFDLVSQKNPHVGEFLIWIINPIKVFFNPIPFGFEWTNSYKSVIVPFLASATGTFLFIQHFRSIPRSFAEVALIEGMGPFSYLWKILIPVSMNTIGALWVIQFVAFWNQYFWPRVIIRDNNAQVIQVAIRSVFGDGTQIEWGVLMAAALIVVIPPTLVFLLLIKQLRRGVSLSTGK